MPSFNTNWIAWAQQIPYVLITSLRSITSVVIGNSIKSLLTSLSVASLSLSSVSMSSYSLCAFSSSSSLISSVISSKSSTIWSL